MKNSNCLPSCFPPITIILFFFRNEKYLSILKLMMSSQWFRSSSWDVISQKRFLWTVSRIIWKQRQMRLSCSCSNLKVFYDCEKDVYFSEPFLAVGKLSDFQIKSEVISIWKRLLYSWITWKEPSWSGWLLRCWFNEIGRNLDFLRYIEESFECPRRDILKIRHWRAGLLRARFFKCGWRGRWSK